jgi:hypothetical protein
MEVHGYSTLLREVPGPGMVARRLVSDEGLHNDDLGTHLAELREWVKLKGGGSPVVADVLDHLSHVQWHYAAVNKPRDLWACRVWAKAANAILKIDEHTLVDDQGRVLIGPGQATGQIPVRQESLDRADRIRRELAAHSLVVPPGALPVRSTDEVRLRRTDLVGRRAVALVLTADFALSVLDGEPLDAASMAKTFPRSFEDRTPAERALFEDSDEELAARLKWGYEAAAQLLAMCGRVHLGFPTEFADQGQVWNASLGIEEPILLPSLQLESRDIVCEEWERARALHHTVTMAVAGTGQPPVGLDPEIVRQRYRALEWLTGDEAWDDLELEG